MFLFSPGQDIPHEGANPTHLLHCEICTTSRTPRPVRNCSMDMPPSKGLLHYIPIHNHIRRSECRDDRKSHGDLTSLWVLLLPRDIPKKFSSNLYTCWFPDAAKKTSSDDAKRVSWPAGPIDCLQPDASPADPARRLGLSSAAAGKAVAGRKSAGNGPDCGGTGRNS